MGHAEHGHTVFSQFDHRVQHLFNHLRIKRRGRFVKEHDPRLHAQGARNRHPLLLTARKLTWIFIGLLRNFNLLKEMHRRFFSFFFGYFSHPNRGQGAIFQDCQMWE